jgi:hypothetical protein
VETKAPCGYCKDILETLIYKARILNHASMYVIMWPYSLLDIVKKAACSCGCRQKVEPHKILCVVFSVFSFSFQRLT